MKCSDEPSTSREKVEEMETEDSKDFIVDLTISAVRVMQVRVCICQVLETVFVPNTVLSRQIHVCFSQMQDAERRKGKSPYARKRGDLLDIIFATLVVSQGLVRLLGAPKRAAIPGSPF